MAPKFVCLDLGGTEDFRHETTAYVFAGMHRYDSGAPVGMLEIVVAAPDPDNIEAKPLQSIGELLASDAG